MPRIDQVDQGSATSAQRDGDEATPGGELLCIVQPPVAASVVERARALLAEREIPVLIERRRGERRAGVERRERAAGARRERRLVRSDCGRRVGERRAELLPAGDLVLPPELGRHRGRFRFVRRSQRSRGALADLEDLRLVTCLQAGDQLAFDRLHDRHAELLFGYLRGMLANRDDAEDIAQDVWAQAFRSLPDFEVRDVPFRVWLFRVARNLALNHLERHARTIPEDPHILASRREFELPAELIDRLPDADLLRALRTLPVSQRQVVVLRFVADLSLAEVAKLIDRSEDAVDHLSRRGLALLRRRLAPLRAPTHAPARREPPSERHPPLAHRRRAVEPRVLAARRLALSWTL